jgi:hypothetical protein
MRDSKTVPNLYFHSKKRLIFDACNLVAGAPGRHGAVLLEALC